MDNNRFSMESENVMRETDRYEKECKRFHAAPERFRMALERYNRELNRFNIEEGHHHWTSTVWAEVLTLAYRYDWRPMRQECPSGEEHDVPPGGRVLTPDETLAVVDALERALEDMSCRDKPELAPVSTSRAERLAHKGQLEHANVWEAKQNQEHLITAIEFLKKTPCSFPLHVVM